VGRLEDIVSRNQRPKRGRERITVGIGVGLFLLLIIILMVFTDLGIPKDDPSVFAPPSVPDVQLRAPKQSAPVGKP